MILTMSDAEFARLWAAGVKLAAIARRAGMTRVGAKFRRRRLKLPPRPVGYFMTAGKEVAVQEGPG